MDKVYLAVDKAAATLIGGAVHNVMDSVRAGAGPITGESSEDLRAWTHVARVAEELFERLDGRTYAEAAQEVRKEFYAALKLAPPLPWDEASLVERLNWEAATRHLHRLVDLGADPNEGVEAFSDRHWCSWVQRRVREEMEQIRSKNGGE